MVETTDRYRVGQPNPEKVCVMARPYVKFDPHVRYQDFSNKARQYILGSILGDAMIGRATNGCFFHEFHAMDQEEYALWKCDSCFDEEFPEVRRFWYNRKKGQHGVAFRTGVGEWLSKMYDGVYRLTQRGKMKKRTMPLEYLQDFDWLAAMIFYFDDGSLSKHHNLVRYAMGSSDIEVVDFVCDWFEKQTGIRPKYHECWGYNKVYGYDFLTRNIIIPAKLRDNYMFPIMNELAIEHGVPQSMIDKKLTRN